MYLINLMAKYLYRKYGLPIHKFFENLTRGISHVATLNVKITLNVKTFYIKG